MADSFIVGLIISAWKAIVRWYDNSMLSRVINSVCDFFVKRASGSFTVRMFLHGFCGGQWWKNSLSYRLLSAPLRGSEARKIKEGTVIDGVLNIFHIPLKYFGAVFIAAAAGMAVSAAACGNIGAKMYVAVIACLIAAAVLCFIFSKSLYALYSGSRIARFIGGFFTDGIYTAPKEKKLNLTVTCTAAALCGIAAGVSNPLFPFAAVIGILFAAAVIARFEIGVYMIIFFAAFLPTSAMAALCVLSLIGFAAALWAGRVNASGLSSFAPLIALYVIFGFFSTLTSFHVAKSAFIFCVYLIFISAYILIINTLTTPARWRAAAVTFAAGALFIGLLGIMQNFTMAVTTQSWVDTQMFEDIKTRVYATFDNPNVLGQYLIITIPIIFSLFWYERKLTKKTVWLGVFAVCFLCLIYTWSRGAWVGVVLGVAVFLLLKDRRWIVLCILGLLALPFVLPPSILNRLLSIGNTGDSSTAYRVSVWIASARMARDFWMSGVGFGSDAFAAVYANYALNGAGFALHSHNFYIQLVVDMGIGGLVTYLLMIATAYREIASVKSRNTIIRNVTLAAAGVLAGYLFQGVAESLWYNLRMSLIFWILMGLIVSGAKIDRTVMK